MKIVLLGYMGSGKSSIGKKLAQALDFEFEDLDSEIEKIEGKTIPQLFLEKGEIYFRKKENSILKELLSRQRNLVLATGGGTPCYGDSLVYLLEQEDVVTVYLKNSLQTLSDRLFSEKAQRPLISHLNTKNEIEDFVRKHLFERSHYYNQAKIIIDGSEMALGETVEKIVQKLF